MASEHVVTRIASISAADAEALLGRMGQNRNVSRRHVVKLARAMAAGHWVLNGEAIKIADTGKVLDGQHRLKAVIYARDALGWTGSVKTLVVEGVSESTFGSMDSGKRRSVADALVAAGETHATTLASALRWTEVLTGAANDAPNLGSEMLSLLNEHPMVRYWASRFGSSQARRFVPSGFAAVLYLGAQEWGDDRAEEFLDLVSKGGTKRSHPAHTLRERLLLSKSSPMKAIDSETAMAMCVKAWNAFVRGKDLRIMAYHANEEFPQLARRPGRRARRTGGQEAAERAAA